jgi:hypothetical protein
MGRVGRSTYHLNRLENATVWIASKATYRKVALRNFQLALTDVESMITSYRDSDTETTRNSHALHQSQRATVFECVVPYDGRTDPNCTRRRKEQTIQRLHARRQTTAAHISGNVWKRILEVYGRTKRYWQQQKGVVSEYGYLIIVCLSTTRIDRLLYSADMLKIVICCCSQTYSIVNLRG